MVIAEGALNLDCLTWSILPCSINSSILRHDACVSDHLKEEEYDETLTDEKKWALFQGIFLFFLTKPLDEEGMFQLKLAHDAILLWDCLRLVWEE
ncbi:hypothetical protein U1Q18_041152 [Sarracenia purpurea var. burkii]